MHIMNTVSLFSSQANTGACPWRHSPPEVLSHREHYFVSDMWMFGTCMGKRIARVCMKVDGCLEHVSSVGSQPQDEELETLSVPYFLRITRTRRATTRWLYQLQKTYLPSLRLPACFLRQTFNQGALLLYVYHRHGSLGP